MTPAEQAVIDAAVRYESVCCKPLVSSNRIVNATRRADRLAQIDLTLVELRRAVASLAVEREQVTQSIIEAARYFELPYVALPADEDETLNEIADSGRQT